MDVKHFVIAACVVSGCLDWSPPKLRDDGGLPDTETDSNADGDDDSDGGADGDTDLDGDEPVGIDGGLDNDNDLDALDVDSDTPDAGADSDADGDCDEEPDGDCDADTGGDAEASEIVPCAGGLLDTTSGLCWQNPASGDDRFTLPQALEYCATMDRGGFGPGSWHLPTISELRSLIRGCPSTVTGGACRVSDSCSSPECLDVPACDGCRGFAGPDDEGAYWPTEFNGAVNVYWSSSPATEVPATSWVVEFARGAISYRVDVMIRCVRPGS